MYALYEYCRRMVTLALWFVGVQGILFFNDLLFHPKVSYPFWDPAYDWAPVLGSALLGVMLASALWMAVARYAPLVFARSQRQLRLNSAVAGLAVVRTKSTQTAASFSAMTKRPQLVQ